MDPFVAKCQNLSKMLRAWGKIHTRHFPWRITRTPYNVLIAEVMLHRTKAEQVASIYSEFIQKYPDIRFLAEANSADLIDILYPLGLHWRIELMHKMAKEIVEKYSGIIPIEKEKLLALPGVGEYIASALRCFSLGYPEPLLDTNTVRIIGRYFGMKISESSRRNKNFRQIYSTLIDRYKPREFNYAMIDLGALICKANDPLCEKCPISNQCLFKSYKNS